MHVPLQVSAAKRPSWVMPDYTNEFFLQYGTAVKEFVSRKRHLDHNSSKEPWSVALREFSRGSGPRGCCLFFARWFSSLSPSPVPRGQCVMAAHGGAVRAVDESSSLQQQ